jgi:hypothetical protein
VAANDVRQAFDAVAATIRSEAKTGSFETPVGCVAALTAVILVGVWNDAVEVHEVALTATGPCFSSTMPEDFLVIGPPKSIEKFKSAASEASKRETLSEAGKVMLAAVYQAHKTSPGYVSPSADFVSVYQDGSSAFTHFTDRDMTFNFGEAPPVF